MIIYSLNFLFYLQLLRVYQVFCHQEDWATNGHGQEAFRNSGRGDGSNSGREQRWPWRDALKKLGVEETLDAAVFTMQKSWQSAVGYNEFSRDWKNLKSEPFNPLVIYSFLKNTTLPAVCRASLQVKKGWMVIERQIMAFTRSKCDKLLGEGAPLHPWNIIKQDQDTVSFVIFVYAVALSLILIRLCSLWNFITLAAMGYTSYVLGGPKFCFKWLVLITGAFWWLFEMVFTYPLHAALIVIAVYFWSYIVSLLRGVTGSSDRHSSDGRRLVLHQQRIENRLEDLESKLENMQQLLARLETEQRS